MSATRPHRKLVKHYHEPGDLHELTFSCYKRQPLLTNDVWRQQLARCIDTAGDEFEMRLARVPLAPPVLFLIEGLHEMLESGHPTIEPATDVCH